jgi:hypothetical protein
MPWSRPFDVPISLSSGTQLRTLGEAALYIVALPKTEQRKEHWQVAAATLIMVAESDGILMTAEIAMRQALLQANRGPPPAQRWSWKSLFIGRRQRPPT